MRFAPSKICIYSKYEKFNSIANGTEYYHETYEFSIDNRECCSATKHYSPSCFDQILQQLAIFLKMLMRNYYIFCLGILLTR